MLEQSGEISPLCCFSGTNQQLGRDDWMQLSPRLAALASLVPHDSKIADIGADHGYLSIYLAQHANPVSVIAADVRPEPLASARRHVEAAELDGRVELRLCDGLAAIAPDEANVIILAGMGGETIQGILERAPWALQDGRLLLLQPQSKQEQLRRWLYAQRCGIQSEHLVKDAGKIYPILCAGGEVQAEPSGADYYIGQWPPNRRDALFYTYLHLRILKLERAVSGLKIAQRQEHLERLPALQTLLAELKSMESR